LSPGQVAVVKTGLRTRQTGQIAPKIPRHLTGSAPHFRRAPASASPTAVSISASGGVRRAYRTVSPSTCSANVITGQSGAGQKNRPHRQPDQHRPAADRRVGQPPLVAAVHPDREPAAARAGRLLRLGPSPDAQPRPGQLGFLCDRPGQVRQQHPQDRDDRV
jgi:hypothetical protein